MSEHSPLGVAVRTERPACPVCASKQVDLAEASNGVRHHHRHRHHYPVPLSEL